MTFIERLLILMDPIHAPFSIKEPLSSKKYRESEGYDPQPNHHVFKLIHLESSPVIKRSLKIKSDDFSLSSLSWVARKGVLTSRYLHILV
jgi:hypothetical protein